MPSLYTLTDARMGPKNRVIQAEWWLRAGVREIQYRAKSESLAVQQKEVATIGALCAQAGARLWVNDSVALASIAGVTGVHVGQKDLDSLDRSAWKQLAEDGLQRGISVSSWADLDRAADWGCDAVGIGAVWPTDTKKNAVIVGLDMAATLARKAKARGLRVIMIGGITPERAAWCTDHGADAVACISAVMGETFESTQQKVEAFSVDD